MHNFCPVRQSSWRERLVHACYYSIIIESTLVVLAEKYENIIEL